MGKNVKKIQDMLTGNYEGKVQVGYGDQESKHRSVGDKWTDSDGVEWGQKNGFYTKVNKLPSVGIFSKKCKDCGKNCSPKMAKPWDRDCFKADGRCYHCQMDYEIDLKADKPIRWFAYRRLKDLRNMEALENDMIQWVDEMEKTQQKNPFDETVANALANGEVEMTINKNLQ